MPNGAHSVTAFAPGRTITDLLNQGGLLEDVLNPAGYADLQASRQYNTRQRKVTQSFVERISTQDASALALRS